MPPRLNHNKTRTGCSRCKARKVKCDELQPRCTACTRHNVDCVYAPVLPRGQQQQPLPSLGGHTNGLVGSTRPVGHVLDPLLELRLMHEWTAFVCTTFSTAWEFWKFQAPLLGFEYRYVLDGLLCLAALHASRQEPRHWSATEDCVISRAEEPNSIEHAFSKDPRPDQWKLSDGFDRSKSTEPNGVDSTYARAKHRSDMLQMSQVYFQRALEGHQRALQAISPDNVEAIYVASICVAYASLFHLSELVDDASSPTNSPEQWARLSRGTRAIVHIWHNMHGDAYLRRSGVFAGLPDLSDRATLYAPRNARPFAKLLTHARDYELLPLSDLEVYAQTLSYVGLIYTGICTSTDHPLATCRRINAMWSVLPERFLELVEEGRPRALAMLMCVFGCMKLIEGSVEWFRGIAEVWVPRLHARMPNAWVEVCGWPVRVVRGDVGSAPVEMEGEMEEVVVGGES